MPDEEGVIKYHLDFSPAEPPLLSQIEEINNWRTLLHQMGLIGQDPERYGGLGYGNISCRLPRDKDNRFILSGTQTGHLHLLGPEHYCLVTGCDVSANALQACGKVKPSSEAITHGALYQFSPDIEVVIHVHCPEIWRCADGLRLPKTGSDTPYGTPELAQEIKGLFDQGAFAKEKIFVIPGHLDGVIAFGSSAENAGYQIVKNLASAIQNFKYP